MSLLGSLFHAMLSFGSILLSITTVSGFQFAYSRGLSGRSVHRAVHSMKIQLSLAEQDNEVHSILFKEYNRQVHGIELIASENFVSEAVLEALGSCMTNKYSEGLPGARYYGGNQHIDTMEMLCQQRALQLYGLDQDEWGVNVQPYSGSPANFAVYTALLHPHERLMGLSLSSGGHLTHGHQTTKRKVSATSIFFESMPYDVHPETGLIDYDELERLALRFQPKLLIAGASAYPRDWDYQRMRQIADRIDAYLMADMAHISGLVAAKQANDPFTHCDVVTTTTHKSLRGPRAGMIFARKQRRPPPSATSNVADINTDNLFAKINTAVFPGLQGGPHNHQIAALAVALKEAASPSFVNYIQQVKANAQRLARALQEHGYVLVTGGTDNHLVLWDVRSVPVFACASKLEKLLERAEISVNKNTVPGDRSAMNPGGIRLGTPAMTTRGLREADMDTIADYLHRAVQLLIDLETIVQLETAPSNESGPQLVKLKDWESFFHSTLEGQSSVSPSRDQWAERFHELRTDVMKFASSFPMPGRPVVKV